MNFLGHAYLSFGHPDILVGNMISDFVKGSARYGFPAGIQKGITLHRLIDDFTDGHGATRAAKEFFRPHYRLYAAPIVDVVYDHLLAQDSNIPDAALMELAQHTYAVLFENEHLLPARFRAMLPYMARENWLYGYKTEAGIFRSLRGLMRRASMNDDGSKACELLVAHKMALAQLFSDLLPDVKQYAKAALAGLTE